MVHYEAKKRLNNTAVYRRHIKAGRFSNYVIELNLNCSMKLAPWFNSDNHIF